MPAVNSFAYLATLDVGNEGSGAVPNVITNPTCMAVTRCALGLATCTATGLTVGFCAEATAAPTHSLLPVPTQFPTTGSPVAVPSGCVTDGGYAPNGTPCQAVWSYNDVTYQVRFIYVMDVRGNHNADNTFG